MVIGALWDKRSFSVEKFISFILYLDACFGKTVYTFGLREESLDYVIIY